MNARLEYIVSYARRMTVVTLVAIGLSACQGPSTRPVTHQIDAEMDRAVHAADQVPKAVSDALLPPMEAPQGGVVRAEPRFDLAVNGANARQVFLSLVKGTSYSVVLAPDVRGQVSLQLNNVTVPEAMESLRRVYGYGFHREGNRFYISGTGIQTRLFQVNYLNLRRQGLSSTTVTAGGLRQGEGAGTTGADAGSSANGSKSQSGAASIAVETRTQTDFWVDLENAVKMIIGNGRDRRVIVNPQTNMVIVRASPAELRVVENFLGVTAQTVGRQVVLEAKIIEVELNDHYQTGVNWQALMNSGASNITIGQTGGGSAFGGTGLTGIAGTSLGQLAPGGTGFTPGAGTAASAFGGVFTLAIEGGNFNAFVEALRGQGQVQVLSSPRVSTINNQKAVIKVGADEFFVTGISVAAGTTGAAQTAYDYSAFFSGIALDVTPQISRTGVITLHIHPTISEVTSQNKPTPSGIQVPFARSVVQESDNVVRARSGQVIVIAGLMKEVATQDNSSIPVLGKIPLAGALFRHKRVVRVKKELIILLRVTVVGNGDWADMIRESRKRMNRARQGF